MLTIRCGCRLEQPLNMLLVLVISVLIQPPYQSLSCAGANRLARHAGMHAGSSDGFGIFGGTAEALSSPSSATVYRRQTSWRDAWRRRLCCMRPRRPSPRCSTADHPESSAMSAFDIVETATSSSKGIRALCNSFSSTKSTDGRRRTPCRPQPKYRRVRGSTGGVVMQQRGRYAPTPPGSNTGHSRRRYK